MESHHNGFKKYFLKLFLYSDVVEDCVKERLNGGTTFYPLHMTLTTIHLLEGGVNLLNRVRDSILEWGSNLPKELLMGGIPTLEVMGHTHIKFLSLCFSCDYFSILDLCKHIASGLGMDRKEVVVNGRKECEFRNSDGVVLLKIPIEEKKTHISLFSTNDLKKYNKKGYNSVMETLVDVSTFYNTSFRVGLLSLS
jgi:hypothetical protein